MSISREPGVKVTRPSHKAQGWITLWRLRRAYPESTSLRTLYSRLCLCVYLHKWALHNYSVVRCILIIPRDSLMGLCIWWQQDGVRWQCCLEGPAEANKTRLVGHSNTHRIQNFRLQITDICNLQTAKNESLLLYCQFYYNCRIFVPHELW